MLRHSSTTNIKCQLQLFRLFRIFWFCTVFNPSTRHAERLQFPAQRRSWAMGRKARIILSLLCRSCLPILSNNLAMANMVTEAIAQVTNTFFFGKNNNDATCCHQHFACFSAKRWNATANLRICPRGRKVSQQRVRAQAVWCAAQNFFC